jgi:hypothetical protein
MVSDFYVGGGYLQIAGGYFFKRIDAKDIAENARIILLIQIFK